jgi:hypothetical protein
MIRKKRTLHSIDFQLDECLDRSLFLTRLRYSQVATTIDYSRNFDSITGTSEKQYVSTDGEGAATSNPELLSNFA